MSARPLPVPLRPWPLMAALVIAGCSDPGDETPEGCAQAEICDGLDQDCDGAVDEGAEIYIHADSDGDGYGAYAGEAACTPSPGYVTDAQDCDDGEAGVYPGAEEVCDGVDQDCDATTDEGAFTTYYADGDGDGFGDPTRAVMACARPPNAVAEGDDCDDGQADVYPGAPETCDGADEDCDGVVDEAAHLESGFVTTACNPSGYGVLISTAGFSPGLSGVGWGSAGPIVYEIPGDNGALEGAQLLTPLGFPMRIVGDISHTGFSGVSYTGDVDAYTVESTASGTLRLTLSPWAGADGASGGASVAGLDLLVYDHRGEAYIGPLSGQTLQVPIASRSTYTLMVAGRSGGGAPYALGVAFEGSGVVIRPTYQIWYGTAGATPFISTATTADGLTYSNFGGTAVLGSDCADAGLAKVLSPTVSPGDDAYGMVFVGEGAEGGIALFEASSYGGQRWTCEGALTLDGLGADGGVPFAPALVALAGGDWALYFLLSPVCADASACTGRTLGWARATAGGPFVYQGALLSGGAESFKAMATSDGRTFTLISTEGEVWLGSLSEGGMSLEDGPSVSPGALVPWSPPTFQGAALMSGEGESRMILLSPTQLGVVWR